MTQELKKIERITLRITGETKQFIQNFSDGTTVFSVAFHNMIDLFSGERAEYLLAEIERLEARIHELRAEEEALCNFIYQTLREAVWSLEDVEKSIKKFHSILLYLHEDDGEAILKEQKRITEAC